MAAIEPIKRSYGIVWLVKWREGGRQGHAMTVTFSDETQAKKFKSLVDEAGNRMPSAKLLEAYGLEWVLGDQAAAPVSPVVARVAVSELCWLYLEAWRPPRSRPVTAP